MKIPKSVLADLALLFITLIWGSTFVVVKKSLIQVSPIFFIALRFWVATAVLLVGLRGSLRNISRETWRRGLILAVVLLGGFIFQTVGLRSTTPSRSAFITGLSVILVPVLGYFLFRSRPRPQTLAGVVMAAVGLGMLTFHNVDLRFRSGDTLTFFSAIVFALHILFLGRYLRGSDYRQLVLLQVSGCAVIATLIMPILEIPFLVWDTTIGLSIFLTGVLATALAFYVQNRAQQFTTPNRTALIFSLEPFFAALFAYLLLGQILTGREWLGGSLILAGIITSEIRRNLAPNETVTAEQAS
jgi:drug/metabolite transporter (DMT)-like permease